MVFGIRYTVSKKNVRVLHVNIAHKYIKMVKDEYTVKGLRNWFAVTNNWEIIYDQSCTLRVNMNINNI